MRLSSPLPETSWTPPVARWRAIAIFGFILLIQLMLSIDMVSIAVALPTIAQDMQASRTAVFSMGTIFSLSATIFQQPIAELSHVLGRKPAFLLVLAMFALGSVVAGTAKSMAIILLGRAMQGFASGGSVLSAIVLSDLIELKDRATWIAYQNATQALGLVVGPLMAGALIKSVGWRWIFLINLPSTAISTLGLSYFLGFDKPQGTMMENLKKVDWVGIGIFIPSAVAFLSPFTMAGVLYPWVSLKALVPLFTGLSGLVLLAAHQRFWAKHPMFLAVIFEKRVIVCALLGLTVFGICVNMVFYYLVVFWSGVRGFDEVLTGVALLPETLTIPIAAILCGLYMRRVNQIHWAMRVGWPLTTVSLGLLWFQDDKMPLPALIVINMGVGFGAGTISSALNVTVLAATAKKINGHAMAMAWLFKSAGMCLGIAMGTAIFTMQMEQHFKSIGGGVSGKMTAESMLCMIKDVKSDPESRGAIVSTLRILWMVCCGLSAFAGILCNTCNYPQIYQKEQPGASIGNVDARLEKELLPSSSEKKPTDSAYCSPVPTPVSTSIGLQQQGARDVFSKQ